jgi:hypothetical protein
VLCGAAAGAAAAAAGAAAGAGATRTISSPFDIVCVEVWELAHGIPPGSAASNTVSVASNTGSAASNTGSAASNTVSGASGAALAKELKKQRRGGSRHTR